MGLYEGLLGGFVTRRQEVEKQEFDRAQADNQREAAIFSTLLNSPDPKTQALAMTGLLESAKPRKKAGGLRGWLGEMEASPYLAQMQALIATPVTRQEEIQSLPARQSVQGVPLAPGVQPALPEATTEPSAALPATSPIATQTTAATPPPTPVRYTQAPPVPTGMTRTVTGPREVFGTPEDQMYRREMGQVRAEVEGDKMRVAAGLPPRYGYRGAGGGALREGNVHQAPDGTWIQDLYDPATGQTVRQIPAEDPRSRSLRAPNPTELEASRQFGLPGEDPRATLLRIAGEADGSTKLAAIQEAVKKNAANAAYQISQQRGIAANETKMAAPLTPDQAAAQGVPFGTTMNQLAGITPVTDDQRKRFDAAQALAPQIDEIRELVKVVFPPQSGVGGALQASRILATKRLARDPDFARLEEKVTLAVGNIARVLAAESGRLTQQDVERAQKALVDLSGWADTQESAEAKLKDVDAAIARIAADLKTPGQVLQERAAAAAATPPPSPGVTPPPAAAAPATTPPIEVGKPYFIRGQWRIVTKVYEDGSVDAEDLDPTRRAPQGMRQAVPSFR